jgi:hypothetical protein
VQDSYKRSIRAHQRRRTDPLFGGPFDPKKDFQSNGTLVEARGT